MCEIWCNFFKNDILPITTYLKFDPDNPFVNNVTHIIFIIFRKPYVNSTLLIFD